MSRILIITLTLTLLALIALISAFRKTKNPRTNYITVFILGLTFLPLGVIFWITSENLSFLILGVVYLLIGFLYKFRLKQG